MSSHVHLVVQLGNDSLGTLKAEEMSTENSTVIEFVRKAIVENESDVLDDQGDKDAESIRVNEPRVFALLRSRKTIK